MNGRFEVNTPICLSFSSFHPEEWQPSWGGRVLYAPYRVVRTILEAIISFFPIESEGAVGSITCSSKLRKQFAKEVLVGVYSDPRVESSSVRIVVPLLT